MQNNNLLIRVVPPFLYAATLVLFFCVFVNVKYLNYLQDLSGFNLCFNNDIIYSLNYEVWFRLSLIGSIGLFGLSLLKSTGLKRLVNFCLCFATLLATLVGQSVLTEDLSDLPITNGVDFTVAFYAYIMMLMLGSSIDFLLRYFKAADALQAKDVVKEGVNINIITQTIKTDKK